MIAPSTFILDMTGYDKKGDDDIMFGKETETFVQSLLLVPLYDDDDDDDDCFNETDLVTMSSNVLIPFFAPLSYLKLRSIISFSTIVLMIFPFL